MTRSVLPLLTATDKKLVQRIVERLYNRHTPAGRDGRGQTREDLFHYGIIGLLEARNNFSPDAGAKWETFAAYRIEGAIIDNLRKAPLIRLPQEAQTKVRELNLAVTELERERDSVSIDDLAKRLGWSVEQVEKTRALKPTLLTAVDDDSATNEPDSLREKVLVEESPECDPQANLLRREISELLEHCLKKLPEVRDRIIVKARQLEDITLKELAKSFNCSIESIRKREKSALIQLKECLQHNDIDEIH